jgi:hypothetical protein
VQRATLLVTVTLSGADSALAARLGAPAGVLPQAVATVERAGSAASRRSDTTDATGRVEFTGLLPGRYQVTVLRLLTPAEVTQFDSVDRDVSAFGGGRTFDVPGPQDTALVEALAGRRGSLVISELFYGTPLVNGMLYNFATYLELYNNSDTTVYLDGKLLGLGPPYIRDLSNSVYNPSSCEDGAPYQLDPDGLWTLHVWRIPGSGRDHALLAGQAVVLATDAVDHRQVDARLPDLSHADFEFIGSADADNPAVPNLIDVGPLEYFPQVGHGLRIASPGIYYVADAVDLAALPTTPLPPQGTMAPRIPRAKILDVFVTTQTPAAEANQPPLCPQLINPTFDRQPGHFFEEGTVNTVIRRVFASLPDGRVILLRTKATANDFAVTSPATPKAVP